MKHKIHKYLFIVGWIDTYSYPLKTEQKVYYKNLRCSMHRTTKKEALLEKNHLQAIGLTGIYIKKRKNVKKIILVESF